MSSRMKDQIEKVRKKMLITKVVATRSFKTKNGDFFCGMSSAWDSCQDDAGGQGADLELSVTDSEVARSGMTVEEARVAQTLLALEASLGALRAAVTDGAISGEEFEKRSNYAKRNTLANLSRLIPAEEAVKKLEATG